VVVVETVVELVSVADVEVVAEVSVDIVSVAIVSVDIVSVAIVSVMAVSPVVIDVSVTAVSVTASSFLQPTANIETTTRTTRVSTSDFFMRESPSIHFRPFPGLNVWWTEFLQRRYRG
jgi:hypothetical protein